MSHTGVALDCCVECKGLWFDGGEVERIIGAETAGPFRQNLSGPDSTPTRLPCPRAHGRMRELPLEPGVVIDGCPKCGGVWMGRGDLLRFRAHLPQPEVASDDRIEGLHLRVDEAQRQADDRRIAAAESEVKSGRRHWILQFLFQFPTTLPMEVYSPVRNRPLATYGLIALNVLVFVLQMFWPDMLISRFGLVPSAFLRGTAPWTMLTTMFTHGNFLHLLGNMYFLGVFGDNVEDRMGVGEYLALYLVGGIAATLAHIASDPASTIPLIGASGAIAAVMGAYLYLFPQRRLYIMVVVKLIRVRAVWYLGLYLALQLFWAAQGAPGVAWWAHIGGFGLGVAAAARHRALLRRRLAALEQA